MDYLKIIRFIAFFTLIIGTAIFIYYYFKPETNSQSDRQEIFINSSVLSVENANNSDLENSVYENNRKIFVSPLDGGLARVTKKPFGIYITSESSPVQPERFTGYHTGIDFEIYSDEKATPVEVKSICNGKIVYRSWVTGYGGVIIQECYIVDSPITILYGHLKLSDSRVSIGQAISAGEILALLGEGESIDTDNERKHLHLSIHKGKQVELRGYVRNQTELNSWHDPVDYIKF